MRRFLNINVYCVLCYGIKISHYYFRSYYSTFGLMKIKSYDSIFTYMYPKYLTQYVILRIQDVLMNPVSFLAAQ